jgi:hypothetical protein
MPKSVKNASDHYFASLRMDFGLFIPSRTFRSADPAQRARNGAAKYAVRAKREGAKKQRIKYSGVIEASQAVIISESTSTGTV